MPPKPTADVRIAKNGPNGRPVLEVLVDAAAPLNQISGAVLKNVTRNASLLRRVGLRACPACISGFDIWIRHRFDEVINVNLERVG
jgi:hypothetical protein